VQTEVAGEIKQYLKGNVIEFAEVSQLFTEFVENGKAPNLTDWHDVTKEVFG
jgi:hypothetical protein